MTKNIEGVKVEILGHTIEFGRLQNPKLKKAVMARKDCFLFNYGDHSDSHSEHSEDYKDYRDHSDYSDYKETHSDTHTEYDTYRDHSETYDDHNFG